MKSTDITTHPAINLARERIRHVLREHGTKWQIELTLDLTDPTLRNSKFLVRMMFGSAYGWDLAEIISAELRSQAFGIDDRTVRCNGKAELDLHGAIQALVQAFDDITMWIDDGYGNSKGMILTPQALLYKGTAPPIDRPMATTRRNPCKSNGSWRFTFTKKYRKPPRA